MNTNLPPIQTPAGNSKAQGKNRIIMMLGILLLISSIMNGITTLLEGIKNNSIQAYVSFGVSIVLAIVYIVSLLVYWQRKYMGAAWLVIIGIQITMLLTISLYSGISVYSIGLQLLLTSLLALSVFTARQNTFALALVLIGGFTSILLDMDWPLPRAASNTAMRSGMLATLILVAIIYIISMSRQFRNFSLYVKLLLAFTLIAILPGTTLGIISANTLNKTLSEQGNRNLTNAAAQTATNLDAFINSGLTNIRAEAGYPVFGEYLGLQTTGASDDMDAEEETYSILSSLSHKDPVFILSYALLSSTGKNVLDTTPENIGNTEYYFKYFSGAMQSGLPYVSSIIIPGSDNIPSIYFSSPVRNTQGEIVGILRVRYNAAILQEIVGRQNNLIGDKSFALLADENYILLANGQDPFKVLLSLVHLDATTLLNLQHDRLLPYTVTNTVTEFELLIPGLEENLRAGNSHFALVTTQFGITDETGQSAASVTMTTKPWTVIFIQPQSEFLSPIRTQIRNIVYTIIAAIVVATLLGLGITQLITTPVERLTKIASQVEQGDLTALATIHSNDEIGTLAAAFNSMTARLRDLVTGLEQRVAERTSALERRAQQIQAAADVGSVAVRLRDIEVLLPQSTHLISQRFGFYHVGIFLLDENGEYAVLYAANSEGGQRMLARKHKLPVGKVGIVGYVTATGQPRIALDVGRDAVFFDNPDLPETRSELAIPLSVGGRILGALDVQSKEASAFNEEDITTLTVLADQISIAIENANLFSETQKAADAARRAYGELSLRDWQRLLQENRAEIGYASLQENEVFPVAGNTDIEIKKAIKTGQATISNDGTTLHVPITIRGNSIGIIRMDKPVDTGKWQPDDVNIANSLAEQLSTALESARLYGDASRRATRERLLSEISAKIGATIRMDTILETAVAEVSQAFSDSEIVLQISNFDTEEKRHE